MTSVLAGLGANGVLMVIGAAGPLARVSEAYDRMMSGKARFRVVLSMED